MNTLRKIITILLVACMTVSMTMPAMAADHQGGTIFGFSGETREQETNTTGEDVSESAGDASKQEDSEASGKKDAEAGQAGAGDASSKNQADDTDAAEDRDGADTVVGETSGEADESGQTAVSGQEAITIENDGMVDAAGELEEAAFFDAQNFADRELTYEGSDYVVTVYAGADAKLPEDASLNVREIKKDAFFSSEYEGYLNQAKETANANGSALSNELDARFFDITIETRKSGLSGLFGMKDEVEPETPVGVKISYKNLPALKEDASVKAIHFLEESDNTMVDAVVSPGVTSEYSDENQNSGDTVQSKEGVCFLAESFSVYGIVYTVDFQYGKYQFSIEGGLKYIFLKC